MANISQRQNEDTSITLLSAQRRLYQEAKRFAALQAVLAGATPVVGSIAVSVDPRAAVWAALAGIIASFINTGVLDVFQQRRRREAATVQEEFDCYVLELPWNEVAVGRKSAPEDVYDAAGRYKPQAKGPLKNWYPGVVDALPIHQGRLVCQRVNCWWDAKLRRRYSAGIVIAVSIIGVFALMLGIAADLSLEKFVLAAVVPLFPTVLWAIREIRRQHDAASAIDRLRNYWESLRGQVIANTLTEQTATRLAREIEDAIFYRRRENPFVFDWIYRLLRKSYEDQMNVGAEALVAEIKSSG